MAKSVIRWTAAEKHDLAVMTAKIFAHKASVPLDKITYEDMLKYRGFFSGVFATAQDRVFHAHKDRIRYVHQHQEALWLAGAVMDAGKVLAREAKQAEPAPMPPAIITPKPTVVDEVLKNVGMSMTLNMDSKALEAFAAVLAPMVAQQVVLIMQQQQATNFGSYVGKMAVPVPPKVIAAPPPLSANKKPCIVMAGLLPIQQSEVENAWGNRFKFKWVSMEGVKRVHAPGAAFAIGMVDFMNHNIDGMLSKRFEKQYIRVNGGVTSIKKALNDLNAKLNLR